MNSFAVKKIFLYVLHVFIFLLLMSGAYARDLLLTAEFIADIYKPGHNKFTNTTPVTSECKRYCLPGESMIHVPGFIFYKDLDTFSEPNEDHIFLSVDGTFNEVELVNTTNPEIKTKAKFRLSNAGFIYRRLNESDGNLNNALLYLSAVKGGCNHQRAEGESSYVLFGWRFPEKKLSCYYRLRPESPYKGKVVMDYLSLGYYLELPSPLSLISGNYNGEINYRISNGKESKTLGAGNADYNGETEIRFIIKATVKHAFHYRFSPGSENVRLTAKGGWNQWINGGRAPDELSKEVPFTLASSSSFQIWMQCEFPQGNGCGLQNTRTGASVPLDVLLTLPGFTQGGKLLIATPLDTRSEGHTIDPPSEYITLRRAKLDFRVRRPAVEKMVKEPGSTWRGTVTLVIDSQMD
ncbi:hypothetical protein JK229_20175 [Pantoea dispersa]|uniref:hypothetical protein n=1 Tax=Pantoea dispersa TaxID=59814 RepID=UPI001BA96568|nr:hypothetical protein [Pantoea dispersa]MBS0907435.1 hypothetical protein [Pantoea dispersa]